MADRVATTTRRLLRAQLAKFLPDEDSIKRFEKLFDDVLAAIPDPVNANAEELEMLQAQIDSLRGQATTLSSLMTRCADLEARLTAAERRAAAITTLQRQVDDIRFLVLGA